MSFFSIYLNLITTLGPPVHSASNRNEYLKQKHNVSGNKVQLVYRDDNLAANCLYSVGPSTVDNPGGLHGLLWG
jgi:hypothetical protein